ncbi:MAG: hypothetical protein NVSMB32_07170 [Actinomycetota bacterium]
MSDLLGEPPPAGREPSRRWFWLGLMLGSPLVLIGIVGLLRNGAVTAPLSFGKWFVAGALVHDFFFAPLVLLAALALRRVVPQQWLAPVQWALALSGIVGLFALIPLVGWGRSPGEPTVQPLNYGRGLAVIVATIWLSAAISIVVARQRNRHAGP